MTCPSFKVEMKGEWWNAILINHEMILKSYTYCNNLWCIEDTKIKVVVLLMLSNVTKCYSKPSGHKRLTDSHLR